MYNNENQEAYEVFCREYNLEQNEDSENKFDNAYIGRYNCVEDFLTEILDNCDIPEWLYTYIDMEKMARDLFYSDYVFLEGQTNNYVFYTW